MGSPLRVVGRRWAVWLVVEIEQGILLSGWGGAVFARASQGWGRKNLLVGWRWLGTWWMSSSCCGGTRGGGANAE